MANSDVIPTISQIYTRGTEGLARMEYKRVFAPDSAVRATVHANRRYLDALFFKPRFLNPVTVDTAVTLFGTTLKTPVFCSPMSSFRQLSAEALVDIANGVKNAGSMLMLGIGGSDELQSAIDTGVPVVKIIKPYQKTDLIYEKLKDAESRGCVAVGMDVDHFYGALRDERAAMTELFGPQSPELLRQIISSTTLPFILKGVLSVEDAREAARVGAAAVMVSSHGSSSVDFALPPIVALPDIAKAVGDKVAVLVDTGFKTGNDVVKALALGARAVGFAGSILLAWGADRSTGVKNLIEQITSEARRTMAVVGCPSPGEIDRSVIVGLAPEEN
jgi:isopentenyl diphosphate isomerase/L-lactate dehydrogenase-like FMN-dependent dehydrogenase